MVEAGIRSVLVAGSGTMGRGIAATFAAAGFDAAVLSRDPARARPQAPGVRLLGALPEMPPDLVIETIPEEIGLKHEFNARIEAAYGGRTVLASNTSALPLQELADRLAHPGRFCGLHYMQPPEASPYVELARVRQTEDPVMAAVAAAAERTGKRILLLNKPVPGLLVNRLQHALAHEAYWLMQEGVTDAATIDLVLRTAIGPRMCINGAIEQKDWSGLLTHALVQKALVPALHHGAEPIGFVQAMPGQGKLGAAGGQGFYDWRGKDVEAIRQASQGFIRRIMAIVAEAEAVRKQQGR